jgi:hypothetical protein
MPYHAMSHACARRPIGRISMDDRSGDFIEHISPTDINLRTLFHFRKPFPPRYDPTHLKRAIPPQPLPLTYSTIGWLMGSGPLTGAQLDTIGERKASYFNKPMLNTHL